MMSDAKKRLRKTLDENDLAAAASMVAQDIRVMSQLVRISYDKDTLVGWRAILVTGMAAAGLVKYNSDFLRETCRKLVWSLSDESGGIGWSAPEMLGEIVSSDPKRFLDIIPLIAGAYDVEEDVFRAGVLYALIRIAEKTPEAVAPYQKIIMQSLSDTNPLVKIRGLELVRLLWPLVKGKDFWSSPYQEGIKQAVKHLLYDSQEAWIYRNNCFESNTVKEAATIVDKSINYV